MNTSPKSKPARRASPPMSRAGSSVFANLAKKTKFVDPELAAHWPTIAGGEIAALGRPGRLTGRGPGRTLEIIAPSGAASAQLQMRADDLVQRVNRYLGPGSITRILVRQMATSRPQNPQNPLGDKDDEPLGQALASFRQAVSRKNGEK